MSVNMDLAPTWFKAIDVITGITASDNRDGALTDYPLSKILCREGTARLEPEEDHIAESLYKVIEPPN